MNEDYEGSRTELMKMLAEHDGPPAYVLRAQRVEEAWTNLVRRCKKEKEGLLNMSKTRLGQVGALVDYRWDAIACMVSNKDYDSYLKALHDEWQPKLRVPLEATDSLPQIRSSMKELKTAFARFNRRWKKFTDDVKLDNVNHERSEYNNYYLVEKSAAFGSDKIAEPLQPCTHEELLAEVPALIEPELI
jgi:hypothetical protein